VIRIPALKELPVAQGFPLAAQTFLGLLTAAVLGPVGKGIAALALAVASLGGATLFLSLYVGVVHAANEGDPRAVLRAISAAVALAVTLLIVGTFAGFAAFGPGVSERQWTLFLSLIAIIVDAPALIVLRSLQGLGHARTYRTGTLIRVGVYVAAALVFIGTGLTPARLIIAFAIGDAAALMYGALTLRNRLRHLTIGRSRRRVPIFRRSIEAHFALLSQQAAYRADVLLLGILSTAANLGQYAVAVAEALWVVSEAISLSVFASTAMVKSDRDDAVIDRISSLRA